MRFNAACVRRETCRQSVHLNNFSFNDTANTEIYTLSLHDALPISTSRRRASRSTSSCIGCSRAMRRRATRCPRTCASRSEEHTFELQSRQYLVCRLLLEKKKGTKCRQSSN